MWLFSPVGSFFPVELWASQQIGWSYYGRGPNSKPVQSSAVEQGGMHATHVLSLVEKMRLAC